MACLEVVALDFSESMLKQACRVKRCQQVDKKGKRDEQKMKVKGEERERVKGEFPPHLAMECI